MSDLEPNKVMQKLRHLIQTDQLPPAQYEPKQMALCNLALAAKLLETAGYEIARTNHAQHTVPLLELSSHVERISRML